MKLSFVDTNIIYDYGYNRGKGVLPFLLFIADNYCLVKFCGGVFDGCWQADIRALSYGCLGGIETSKCPAKASEPSANGFHSTSCLSLALLAIHGSHRYDTYGILRSSNPLLKCHRTEPLYPPAGCSFKKINF